MYGARWWFEVARVEASSGTPGGGSSRRLGERVVSGTPGGGSSRRLGDRVGVDYLLIEEHRKKVAMYGLLDRAGGKRTSSRFCL
jgi:hypothetical protein